MPVNKLVKRDNEVEVTQYLRPDGKTRKMYAPVGDKIAKMAEDKDLIISTEILTTGLIALYVRRKNKPEEDERLELANNFDNGSGKDPNSVLIKMIKEA